MTRLVRIGHVRGTPGAVDLRKVDIRVGTLYPSTRLCSVIDRLVIRIRHRSATGIRVTCRGATNSR